MPRAIRALLIRSAVEIGIFSTVISILLLVPSVYLLQIYDRIIPSNSHATLLYITILGVGALIVFGLLEIARRTYSNRVASRLSVELGSTTFFAAMNGAQAGLGEVQPLRDLATVRSFIASRTLSSLFDLPFGPLFIALLYLIHPMLFLVTVIGGTVMVAIALANQVASSRSDREAAEELTAATASAALFARNFETVRALGMTNNAAGLWGERFARSLIAADKATKINGYFSAGSRTTRMILQLAILGVGGYLVIEHQMTAGMIFASSLISGRALQPLDQIIGSWPHIVQSWRAWKRLRAASAGKAAKPAKTIALPEPEGNLAVEQVVYFPPNSQPNTQPLIKRVNFVLKAGESAAIIGPSQAGKSTLARLMVGAIQPSSGVVRIDGADITNWDPDALGKHIGYLPQEVELFPGTIGENISRFDRNAADEDIVSAARQANVHDLVLREPRGYATLIGPGGIRLSGGERQRIGLARAFYGKPRLMVLDEPNANLDTEGEAALEDAMRDARQRGITLLIITHRPTIASRCDRILLLKSGQIELYGPAEDVLRRMRQGEAQPAAAPAPSPVPPSPVPPAPSPATGGQQPHPTASGRFANVVRAGR